MREKGNVSSKTSKPSRSPSFSHWLKGHKPRGRRVAKGNRLPEATAAGVPNSWSGLGWEGIKQQNWEEWPDPPTSGHLLWKAAVKTTSHSIRIFFASLHLCLNPQEVCSWGWHSLHRPNTTPASVPARAHFAVRDE